VCPRRFPANDHGHTGEWFPTNGTAAPPLLPSFRLPFCVSLIVKDDE
jgi:hypothetical protein